MTKTLADLTDETTARTAELERLPAVAGLANAKQAIAEARTVHEAKDIRDQAEALHVYSRRQHLAEEIQVEVAEIKLRAERRVGQLLAATQLNAGARGSGANQHQAAPQEVRSPEATAPRLAELGVSKSQSSRWQAVAALPDDAFESHVAGAKARGRDLSVSAVLSAARREEQAEAPAPTSPPLRAVPDLPTTGPNDLPVLNIQLADRGDGGADLTVWEAGTRAEAGVRGRITRQRAVALIEQLERIAHAPA